MFNTCSRNEIHAEDSASFSGDEAGETKRRLVRKELACSYQRYRALAARRLRDEVAADDVVQAFALKAMECFEQLRDARAVHGWLRRLFETTLIDLETRCQREVASGEPNATGL
ncbi:sigma factor [Rhizorhapis sp. SPR117]|uniref:sigma factor n=1 Tax=Rhizorhapis sp. SPR117 TaxID=2912611 RepID=UPI001F39CBA8|nr:hypothetical protein [Rhizorhapis sp. SPR117]